MTILDGWIFNTPSDERKENKIKQWIFGLIANTLIFTYGIQLGWTSPNIAILQSSDSPSGYSLTNDNIALIVSLPCISAVLFCIPYSIIIDKFGRKIGLILIAFPEAVGFILKLISANFGCLLISQFIVGISWAGSFTVTPLYTKEIASDSIRGALGGFGMLMQSVGTLLIYALGAFFDYYTMLWAVVWIPILNMLMLFGVPETPPYLIKMRKDEKAKEIISNLNGIDTNHRHVKQVLEELKKAQNEVDKSPMISLSTMCGDKATKHALCLGLFLITLLDTGGNFAIVSYASVIIKNSGVTVNPLLQTLSIPLVMLIGALLSSITIEKFGRKPLLIFCLLINGIPMLILAALLIILSYGYAVPSWLAVVCVTISIFSYGAGILPIPYIVLTEIFTFQIRAKVMGYFVTYGWALCFLQDVLFTPVSDALGMQTVFIIFGVVNILFAIGCMIWMPETKGKSLEEIRRDLANN